MRNYTKIYVDGKRLIGRVPKKCCNNIVIKASLLPDGRNTRFPCPFCTQEIMTNGNTNCPECEAKFIYHHTGQEVILTAARDPKSPVL